MEITLPHIIGTVALISLVVTAGLSYEVFTHLLHADIDKQQLKQVSEHVALNIVEMANLIKFSLLNNDNPMVKNLNLPTDLNEKSYQVQIKHAAPDSGYIVHSYLTSKPTICADVTIPLNVDDGYVELVTDSGDFVAGIDNTQFSYNGTIYGTENAIVWGRAQWNETTGLLEAIQVGIGWKK